MVKHGIKKLFRTPVKTISFFLLIAIVTMFLGLGLNMLISGDEMLKEADERFSTVARVEFLGENYPDMKAKDERLEEAVAGLDIDDLMKTQNVLSYEPNVELRAYAENFNYALTKAPYPSNQFIALRLNEIVYRCTNVKDGSWVDVPKDNYTLINQYNESKDYYVQRIAKCTLIKTLYAHEPMVEGIRFELNLDKSRIYDDLVTIRAYELTVKGTFKEGGLYVTHGYFDVIRSYSQEYEFVPTPFYTEAVSDDEAMSFVNRYLDGGHRNLTELYYGIGFGYYSLIEVGSTDDIRALLDMSQLQSDVTLSEMSLPELWQQMIRTYQVVNGSFDVVASDSVEKIPGFHQGEIYIKDGRFYNESDGANVIVMHTRMASALNLKVGDKVSLGMHYAKKGNFVYDSYWPAYGYDHEVEYTVIGIYDSTTETGSSAYIPYKSNLSWIKDNAPVYNVGTFTIKNGTGNEFLTDINKKLESPFRVTVYDQGYEAVARPLAAMKETSILMISVSVAAGVIVLLMFAYLFITKQRSDIRLMLILGTGIKKSRRAVMVAATLLVLVSVLVGGVIGVIFTDDLIAYAYNIAENASAADVRFGAVRTRPDAQAAGITVDTNLICTIGSCVAVLIVAAIFCALFILAVMKEDRKSEIKTFSASVRRFVNTIRMALRSALRNSGRSTIMAITALALAIAVTVFSGVIVSYDEKINDIYDNTKVIGKLTSVDGSMDDGLVLDNDMLSTLMQSGYTENESYSITYRYYYNGRYSQGDTDKPIGVNPGYGVEIPEGFAKELFEAEVFDWSKLMYTNNISGVPAFAKESAQLRFKDGYTAEDFNESDENVCVVSSAMFKMYNMQIGDVLNLTTAEKFDDAWFISGTRAEVVGIFGDDTTMAIYAPIRNIIYTGILEEQESNKAVMELLGAEEEKAILESLPTVKAFSFELADNKKIDEFRQYLTDNGYGYPGKMGITRKTVVLDDATLISSTSSIQKVAGYINALYPVVFGAIVIIALIVSYTVTKSRKPELAMLRSMGYGRFRVFVTFFIEQLIIAIVGTAIGVLAMWLFVYRTFAFEQVIAVLIYMACYVVGVAIAIMAMNKGNVLKILSSKE